MWSKQKKTHLFIDVDILTLFFNQKIEVVSSCTILFSDVVGFTQTCSLLAPMEVVSMLNAMYTKFDRSLEKHDVYKVIY